MEVWIFGEISALMHFKNGALQIWRMECHVLRPLMIVSSQLVQLGRTKQQCEEGSCYLRGKEEGLSLGFICVN